MNRMHFEPIRIYFSHLRSSTGGLTSYCARFHRLNNRMYSGCTQASSGQRKCIMDYNPFRYAKQFCFVELVIFEQISRSTLRSSLNLATACENRSLV